MGIEIKFRVWNAISKTMVYPSIIGINLENFAWIHDRSWLHNSIEWDGEDGYYDGPELMQYTGLKDKNGKYIYEDDIILHGKTKEPCLIKFKEGSFGCTGPSVSQFLCFANDHCEVIGNIHQNPELYGN